MFAEQGADLDAMERPDNGEWLRWDHRSEQHQNTNQRNGTMTVVGGSAAVLPVPCLALRDRQMQLVESYRPRILARNCEKMTRDNAVDYHDAARRNWSKEPK